MGTPRRKGKKAATQRKRPKKMNPVESTQTRAMTEVTYRATNSGGLWWLRDKDWRALEKAGWDVQWKAASKTKMPRSTSKRWLGALATEASKRFVDPVDAIREFAKVTKKDAAALSICKCCAPPHTFSWRDKNLGTLQFSGSEIEKLMNRIAACTEERKRDEHQHG